MPQVDTQHYQLGFYSTVSCSTLETWRIALEDKTWTPPQGQPCLSDIESEQKIRLRCKELRVPLDHDGYMYSDYI